MSASPTSRTQSPNGHYESTAHTSINGQEELEQGLLLSPDHEHELLGEQDQTQTPIHSSIMLDRSNPGSTPITRTVAIIKTHALEHRFEIERRIQEASFEIAKERQMEFDTETDPDTLYELFGEDTDSLAEGPVWVYVLERRRAVQVWNTLMGDRDVAVARHESPNSLRALYGLSYQQNALMGSPDNAIAEIQIASLFASSPPFHTTDLPSEDNKYGSIRSITSSVLESVRRAAAAAGDDEGYAPSSATNPSTVGGGSSGHPRLSVNGKALFKARPVPATMDKPDIIPRTTRAAALRAGQPIEKTVNTPRAPVSKERLAQTFANVPGHKRSSTISVASTAAPAIAPRMTRAASLRLGQAPPAPVVRRRSMANEGEGGAKATFEGVPGHKRRESIAVASMKAPTVAPRLNKSSALRAQKDQAPPTSFMFRSASAAKTPTLSRASSSTSLNAQKPVVQRPASQASVTIQVSVPLQRTGHNRASSVASVRPPPSQTPKPASKPNGTTSKSAASSTATPGGAQVNGTQVNRNSNGEQQQQASVRPASAAAATPKPRRSSFSAPNIPPRTNRSAVLRAAKQEAENAAAVAAAARKAPRPSKVPPSSFKAVVPV